jgi:hypothetical protein
LLFGYLCPRSTVPDGEVAAFTRRLTAYAETEGFALCAVFVEESSTGDAAFTALLTAARRYATCVVAVPALDHLARVPLAMQRLEHEAGAQVLVVSPRHPGT